MTPTIPTTDLLVSVELPVETVVLLRQRAKEAGQTVTEYIRALTDSYSPNAVARSLFDLIGTAPQLRTAASIDQQCREERESWGEG